MADNHGNTPAAWTAVALALAGFVVGGIGTSLSPINYTLFWIGVALVAVAGIAFVVMAKMGMHESSH